MEARNYPVLTNKAPNNTRMSMDASVSNNNNTPPKNNNKNEKEKDGKAPNTTPVRDENKNREESAASRSPRRENENREESADSTTRSSRRESREESAASTTRSSRRENENREESAASTTRSSRSENENREESAASTTRSSRRENENREDGIAPSTTSARIEAENREDGKAAITTSAKKENENGKESETSTTRSSRRENENREESAASTTRSSRSENENREEGKAPNTTSTRKETDKREDGKAAITTSTKKENENGEESAASTSRSSRKENENREEGKAPNTTSTRKKTENRKKSERKSNKQQSKDKVRPLPKPPTDQPLQNPTPQTHVRGNERSEGPLSLSAEQDPFLKEPLPGIWSNIPQTQKDSTSKQQNSVETKASTIVMGLKGIIMVAAIVLISSSEEISKAKSCDLEKALKSISLNYTVSCEYDEIKNISTTLRHLGISLLALNLLFFPLILVFMLLHRKCKFLVCVSFPFIGIYSVFMIMEHDDILYSKTLQTDMNYVQLQSAMTIWLEAHYASDNISSNDAISNSWNKFFIEYDCCAVNQVKGTTNDFDSTPWCTTLGTCQSTASQIPRTCCIGVSEDDYGSAPSDCHSSVNPGTFRSNCMNVIKQLSAVNIEECQLSLLQMSLIIIATLELIATAFEIIATIIWIILWALDKQKSKKEDNKKKDNTKKKKQGE